MNQPNTEKLKELTERFHNNIESYKSGQYNETQARQEFINPFFKLLNWDVDNEQGYAEAYKDVVHEDAIKIGGKTKAPDYCFRIGGTRKFFVEAKKPSINIKDEPHPAYQLRRYAWSAKLPLSILTDFEEMAVYDCRLKPVQTDPASKARVLYITYDRYEDRWEEISSIFSRDSILKGSFDKYAESNKAKKGTAEVDTAFLEEISSWREILARNIALRNPELSQRELNFSVQMIIDRIIFLRICEDRGIENYGRLQELQKYKDIYKELTKLFQQADDRYNSGLFHFRREKDNSEAPDDLTLNLAIDDKTMKDILKNLYYPESPYEFSVLPAEILGQIYEQFLGKIIAVSPGRRVSVEEKPEVKKAGGVYYTPTYIVDYIVKETVGKILEGKTPKQAEKITILDPACGSGSFLIGAYQYLLDWHKNWYIENNPEKWAGGKTPKLYQTEGGDWFLTTGERKKILLNNIYGVDIDNQAVEVTKLSLLLKVLEGESDQRISTQLKMFQERALPNLGNNIKCGNSLIGIDFFKDNPDIAEDELYRINPFDWHGEFTEVMKNGGFDVVIGNPPYIRIQTMKEWASTDLDYYKQKYKSTSKGNYDIYVIFVERGLQLLNENGCTGFILPHKFFNSKYGEPLREIISQGKHLNKVIHFGAQQIFTGATTYTCLLFLSKLSNITFNFIKIENLINWRNTGQSIEGKISTEMVLSKEWNFVVGKNTILFEKLTKMPFKLGNVANIFVGVQTSADDIFIMDLVTKTENEITLNSKSLNIEWTFETTLLFPIVSGTDVSPYKDLYGRQYILFPYTITDEKADLIDFNILLQNYPKTANYLLKNKQRLENREKGKFKDSQWYRFGRNQNIGIQMIKKLCIPRLVEYLYATYDTNGSFILDNVDVGGVIFTSDYKNHNLLYLLGLVNSKLLRWYFPFVSAPFRGGWLSANRQFLSQVPIRIINFNETFDKIKHDQIVELVNRMLISNQKLSSTRTPQEKNLLQRQIEMMDRQINQLVYELYELTEEEIKIIEEII
ncbi:MAG TPA: Eco57I restriction-modification methylase domain-containing protein [Candidatus Eremiobacteraeota bacterium]|nr:MAG: Type IIS restriction enzyme Eco57I [bacterium ADurb.Bin363]HPZ09242.1 Eco57I restriction-modification methylase domain-containing protein [Candidatus Eremiobacteraeota bacterium]